MYLIVGLGNPGNKYEKTRHNVGFLTIDILANKLNIKVDKLKFKALLGEGKINNEKVILVKPQTYMNLSGESVRDILNFYKIPLENMFVVYDDIDLNCGQLRIRKKGSGGTHNGMRNIIYLLGKDGFPRFRIGVSKPNKNEDLANFVLSNFRKEEIPLVGAAIDSCVDSLIMTMNSGIEKAMNQYNV